MPVEKNCGVHDKLVCHAPAMKTYYFRFLESSLLFSKFIKLSLKPKGLKSYAYNRI